MTTKLKRLHEAAMPPPWAIVKYSKRTLALGQNMHEGAYMVRHVNVDADDPLVVADFALVKYLRNHAADFIALIEAARETLEAIDNGIGECAGGPLRIALLPFTEE